MQLRYTKPFGCLFKNKKGILLSGGMDSIALAYWIRPSYSITIDYGQNPAKSEIQAARQVSKFLGISHHIIEVDCSELGSGDMIKTNPASIAPVTEWWPFRNQLIVTLASMKAIQLNISELFIGSVCTDSSHKDGSKEFYSIFSDLISYQEGSIELKVPAIDMSTIELIKNSKIPKTLLLWAHSCHTSNNPCMACNGCKKYLYILQKLGID